MSDTYKESYEIQKVKPNKFIIILQKDIKHCSVSFNAKVIELVPAFIKMPLHVRDIYVYYVTLNFYKTKQFEIKIIPDKRIAKTLSQM